MNLNLSQSENLLFALCFLIACGGSNGSDGISSSATSGSDISVLPELAYSALPVFRLRDIGPLCNANAETCAMSGISAAAVSAIGDVQFLGTSDGQPQVYRVRDAGAGVIPVGREGAGPGEYRRPWTLGFDSTGNTLVASISERRLLAYAADGASEATATIPLPPTMFATPAFVNGELRALATELADSPGDSMPVVMFALDSGASNARRVYEMVLRAPAIALGDFRPMQPPFTPQAQWVIRPDGGLLHSAADALLIDMYGPDGRHTRRIGYTTTPRAVTSAELQEALEGAIRYMPNERMRGAMVERFKSGSATRHPAITRLTDAGDQIWVRESPFQGADSVSWVIFDADGRGLGRAITGTQDAVVVARGDSILMSVDRDTGPAGSLRWMMLERQ